MVSYSVTQFRSWCRDLATGYTTEGWQLDFPLGAKDFSFHRNVRADWLCGSQSLCGRLGQKINHFFCWKLIQNSSDIQPVTQFIYRIYIFRAHIVLLLLLLLLLIKIIIKCKTCVMENNITLTCAMNCYCRIVTRCKPYKHGLFEVIILNILHKVKAIIIIIIIIWNFK